MKRLARVILLATLTACSTPPAPVVDRSEEPRAVRLENDGRYRVRRGDTLYAIAFRFGLDHRDIARWNGIAKPYVIYPEQLLRLTQPLQRAAVSREPSPGKPPSTSKPTPKPRISTPVAKTPAGKEAPRVVPSPKVQKPASTPTQAGDPKTWLWPVSGRVLRGFLANDPSRNGLDIAGREGQEVKSTAAGSVVYSGNGLIGFGELIIIKHSERMLSAYAHNKARLVKEGDQVKAGQKIAELGRNDRNEPILHFEIRVNGKPVDPRRFLP